MKKLIFVLLIVIQAHAQTNVTIENNISVGNDKPVYYAPPANPESINYWKAGSRTNEWVARAYIDIKENNKVSRLSIDNWSGTANYYLLFDARLYGNRKNDPAYQQDESGKYVLIKPEDKVPSKFYVIFDDDIVIETKFYEFAMKTQIRDIDLEFLDLIRKHKIMKLVRVNTNYLTKKEFVTYYDIPLHGSSKATQLIKNDLIKNKKKEAKGDNLLDKLQKLNN